MTRYTLDRCAEIICDAFLKPDPDGAWVKWEDVEALKSKLAALDWIPIDADHLPKFGDEIFGRWGASWGVYAWSRFEFLDYALHAGYTHYRPINPPQKTTQAKEASE